MNGRRRCFYVSIVLIGFYLVICPRGVSADPVTFSSLKSGNWFGSDAGYIWERSSTNHWHPSAGDTANVFGFSSSIYLTCSVSVATLNVSNGDYEGWIEIYNGATLTLDSSGSWAGGKIGGGGGCFVNRGSLSMPGTNRTIVQGTMINSNLITHTGPGDFGMHAAAYMYNATGSVFNLANDIRICHSTGGGAWEHFVNLPGSTFRKSGGAGVSQAEIPFDIYGALIDIQSGTFHVGSSSASSNATYMVSSGAVLDFSPFYEPHYWSGTHVGTGLGRITINSNNIVLTGTPVTFDFTSNLFHWSGGEISCGQGPLNNKGFLHLDGAGTKSIKGYMINSNRMQQTGTGNFDVYWLTSGFQNATGALYDIQGDGGVVDGIFDNYGTFRKSGGSGTSIVAGTFNNYGAIQVSSGTLNLRAVGNRFGTTYQVSPGATLDLTPQGDTDYSGVHSAAGGGRVVLNGNGIQISTDGATFNFPTNVFQWQSGSIMDNILTNQGVFHLVGSGAKKVHHFVNKGWVLQEGTGNFGIHGNGYMINASGAVFEIKTDAGLTLQGEIPTFYNEPSGVVRKVGGTGTSDFAAVFYNRGLLEVRAGTLLFSVADYISFGNFYAQTGSLTRLMGGHIASDRFYINSGTVAGTGILQCAVHNNGIVAPGNTTGTLCGLTSFEQTSGGELDIDIGGPSPGSGYDQLCITGFVYFGGTLNVSLTNGYNPAGHTYSLLTYDRSYGGRFAVTNLPSLAAYPGLHWQVDYRSNAFVIAPAAYYALKSGSFTGYEASTLATITVTRTSAESGDLTLWYSTMDGSARSGMDFVAVTGTVTMTGAQLTNTFTIPLINNSFDALSDRSFTVMIGQDGSYPYEGSSITTATVTIVDDDLPTAVSVPFYESFESGAFSNYWSLYCSNPAGELIITTNYGPRGTRHVLMDSSAEESYALEELILTVNLTGQKNVWLTFYQKDINDEHEVMTNLFTQHANADGVAISSDGSTWYAIQQFTDWDNLSSDHRQFAVSLDQYGLTYNANFKIKFQHYGDYPVPDNGIGFDDIRVFVPVGLLRFATNNVRVGEAAGTATIRVERAGATTAAVSCAYYADGHSIVAGDDFTGGTGSLSFAVGQATQSFTVAVVNDSIPEANEWTRFWLTDFDGCAPTNPAFTTLTVVDDESTNFLTENFDAGVLPSGWTVRTNGAAAACWRFDKPGSWSNCTGGFDGYATANSDFAGSVNMDTELRTPVFNFTDMLNVFIEYRTYFWRGHKEIGDIDYSTNGAAGPWVPFCRYQNSTYAYVYQGIDVSPLAGKSSIMFRFHYYNATNEWWWQIDEVQIYGEVDSDHDGLPNWWEFPVSGTATGANPWADNDTDYFANYLEYRAGTSATDSNSFLKVGMGGRAGTNIVIRWPSAQERYYRVDRSTNLISSAGFNVNIQSNILATPPENTVTDTTASGRGPWMYRIEVE